jgi:hypothetical protein
MVVSTASSTLALSLLDNMGVILAIFLLVVGMILTLHSLFLFLS